MPDSPVQPIVHPIRLPLESIITEHLHSTFAFPIHQPNAEPLWASIRFIASNYLTGLWHAGALKGNKPEQAFFVKCGPDTMTQNDIDNGTIIVVVGIAPIKPAEFVEIRIALLIPPPK